MFLSVQHLEWVFLLTYLGRIFMMLDIKDLAKAYCFEQPLCRVYTRDT